MHVQMIISTVALVLCSVPSSTVYGKTLSCNASCDEFDTVYIGGCLVDDVNITLIDDTVSVCSLHFITPETTGSELSPLALAAQEVSLALSLATSDKAALESMLNAIHSRYSENVSRIDLRDDGTARIWGIDALIPMHVGREPLLEPRGTLRSQRSLYDFYKCNIVDPLGLVIEEHLLIVLSSDGSLYALTGDKAYAAVQDLSHGIRPKGMPQHMYDEIQHHGEDK